MKVTPLLLAIWLLIGYNIRIVEGYLNFPYINSIIVVTLLIVDVAMLAFKMRREIKNTKDFITPNDID